MYKDLKEEKEMVDLELQDMILEIKALEQKEI